MPFHPDGSCAIAALRATNQRLPLWTTATGFICLMQMTGWIRLDYGLAWPALMALAAMLAMRGLMPLMRFSAPTALSQEARARLKRLHSLIGLVTAIEALCAIALFVLGDNDENKGIAVATLVALGLIAALTLVHSPRLSAIMSAALCLTGAGLATLFVPTEALAPLGLALAAIAVVIVGANRVSAEHFNELVRAHNHITTLGQENAALTETDLLTDLHNRRHFFRTLDFALRNRDESDPKIVVGVIDLDGFKPINDTYGHAVGDIVLTEVAARLAAVAPNPERLCHIGSDEFAFFMEHDGEKESVLEIGQRFIAALQEPIAVGDVLTSVGCSVGLAIHPDANASGDTLYERADFALCHAKSKGRGRAMLYDGAHQSELAARGAIEQALRTASLSQEIYPLFQPIVSSSSRRTVGFECLARWESPVLGPVPPGQFIPVAEQASLITPITLSLLGMALEEARKWPSDMRLSFNLSADDIASSDAMLRLLALIERSGLPPQRLSFEITETALMKDFDTASGHIAALKRLGCRIALDDFGTGYSSFSQIRSLPLDTLKIDRQFITDMTVNQRSLNIVRSILSLCRDMGISCVAEGVETSEQAQVLQDMGCADLQGYWFAKPMDTVSTALWLAQEAEDQSRRA